MPTATDSAIYEMSADGAWGEDGEAWFPRSCYTRSRARTAYANHTGEPWIEIRVLARYMRHAPDEDPGDYDGEYWVECPKDDPWAFPVWRCEWSR